MRDTPRDYEAIVTPSGREPCPESSKKFLFSCYLNNFSLKRAHLPNFLFTFSKWICSKVLSIRAESLSTNNRVCYPERFILLFKASRHSEKFLRSIRRDSFSWIWLGYFPDVTFRFRWSLWRFQWKIRSTFLWYTDPGKFPNDMKELLNCNLSSKYPWKEINKDSRSEWNE